MSYYIYKMILLTSKRLTERKIRVNRVNVTFPWLLVGASHLSYDLAYMLIFRSLFSLIGNAHIFKLPAKFVLFNDFRTPQIARNSRLIS